MPTKNTEFSGLGVKDLSNDTTRIYFYSFSTKQKFWFNAFLTQFNDSYKSDWSSQAVYGRMDPIVTFKHTTRKINFTIDIPSFNIQESIVNNFSIDLLIQSLYPIYKDGEGGTSIMSTPPLFKIKFSNLIKDKIKLPTGKEDILESGIFCYLDGFDYTPDIESGFFISDNGEIFPKLLKATFNLNVIHQKPLGNYLSEDKKVYNRYSKGEANKDLVSSYNHIDGKDYKDILANETEELKKRPRPKRTDADSTPDEEPVQ